MTFDKPNSVSGFFSDVSNKTSVSLRECVKALLESGHKKDFNDALDLLQAALEDDAMRALDVIADVLSSLDEADSRFKELLEALGLEIDEGLDPHLIADLDQDFV